MIDPEEPMARHVAVLDFPFGGHTRPMLGLVSILALRIPDTRFSFFTTKKWKDCIFSKGEYGVPNNITPYEVADGVPENHEFSGNPHELADLFLRAAVGNFKRAVEFAVLETGLEITSILADAFMPFAEEMAEEMHVPWVYLWVAVPHNLYVYLFLDDICRVCDDYRNGQEEAQEIVRGVPAMRIEDLPEGLPDGAKELGDLEGCLLLGILNNMSRTLPRATATVLNFCKELDPTPLTDYISSHFPSFLYLGPLTLSLPPPRSGFIRDTDCLSWLDKHEPQSVAYISFGTIGVLHQDELSALAEVLEECKITYLWSLRDKLKEDLPKGFVERTGGHGVVVPWAPQIEVLQHPSVDVFVTHGGSNSVYESIASGVPMICRPFFGDHRMVVRLVSEVWGIGVNVENGIMTKDGMKRSFGVVFGDEKGKKLREKAKALKEVVEVAGGPEGKAAQDFKVLVDILG